jgi:hypothetical protein
LWGAFSLAAWLEQPLYRVGNEQVPVGINLPLDSRSALFPRPSDPKPGHRLDPLAQQSTSRGLNEIVARTGHWSPS